MEIALSTCCGPEDIVTPITGKDEQKRRELGGRGPQNHEGSRWGRAWGRLRGKEEKPFYNHMTAREVRARLPDEVWEHYFKFTVVRNPWDRAVSQYFWCNKQEPRPPFRSLLEGGGLEALQQWGWDLYTIDDAIAVDEVLRFEELGEGLERVRERLGLSEPFPLVHAKGQFRPKGRPDHEFYGDWEREEVARVFAREIEHFGYTFAGVE